MIVARKFILPLLAAAWLLVQVPGAGSVAADHRFLEQVPQRLVQAVMGLARDNIGQAKLMDGSLVPPETPAERAETLVPFAEAEPVVDAGVASAHARWCGEDWESNYRHLMAYQRGRKIWPEKALAYIGLMHGVTLGLMKRDFDGSGQCPASDRRRIRDFIERGN